MVKTLSCLVLEPEAQVDELFQRAQRGLMADVLSDSNEKLLLMLQAVATELEPFVKAVYQRYRQLSRQAGEEPFCHVYFYASLSYLQSLDLILLVATKVTRI